MATYRRSRYICLRSVLTARPITWCSWRRSMTACMRSTPIPECNSGKSASSIRRQALRQCRFHAGVQRDCVQRSRDSRHSGHRSHNRDSLCDGEDRGKSSGDTSYYYRLHALDITTGLEKFGGPVPITGKIGNLSLVILHQIQRPGLLLSNGTLYIGFGSNGCDLNGTRLVIRV